MYYRPLKTALLLWFILTVIIRPLLLFRIAERIVWWTSAGKQFTPWLSASVVLLNEVLIICVPFPVWCLGKEVEFDCIGC